MESCWSENVVQTGNKIFKIIDALKESELSSWKKSGCFDGAPSVMMLNFHWSQQDSLEEKK